MSKRRHKIPKEELSRILVIGKGVARNGVDPEKFLKSKNWCDRRQRSFWIGYNLKTQCMTKQTEDTPK